MIVIPAIDILDGRCVRLTRGSYEDVAVYNEDPVEVARSFEKAGAARIHIVDLDAARGNGNNREIIGRIRAATRTTIEVGGGVRQDGDVAALLDVGVDRVVVGTVLAREPVRVENWCRRHGNVIIAGIDALDGQVRVSGWQEVAPIRDVDLAIRAGDLGCVSIIYTSIGRDGMLAGPDIDNTNAVARAGGLPVILSGGISSVSDIELVIDQAHPNVQGIIVGKALYAGRVDLPHILTIAGKAGKDDKSEGAW